MSHFKLALNTSTLFPFNLDVIEQVQVTAEAGYDGIELWVKDIEAYLEDGGSIKELNQVIHDSGILVVNAIAFFKWSDIDEATRQAGLEQAKRELAMLTELGCPAVAAPPSGNVEKVSLDTMASHFAELIEIARHVGIEPYLEFWGKASKLSRLSEAVYVAMESGVSDAMILPDLFHMYTGGSSIDSLSYLNSKQIGIVHVNDYPASPARENILDADRVFPGEGIAPTQTLADLLSQSDYRGYLSLELFIEDFGNRSPLTVAKHGLEKIKQAYCQE